MSFVVYVNHPTNRAIVHNTDCGFYQSRKTDETLNGYWTDPMPNLEVALNYAKAIGKKFVGICSFCCKPVI